MQDHEFRAFVERVKLSASIEDVVRTRVGTLKRAGRLYEACCPFHEEKTPSFKVDPERGTWRCYGACAEGGDVISFLQQADNATFMEALKSAASIAGVPLPEGGLGSAKRSKEEERNKPLLELLARAEKLYRRHLLGPEGAAARRYLEERGLGPEVCEIFGVGWAPDSGSPLLTSATSAGVKLEQLEQAGLCKRRDDGSGYDFFYNRVIIPIRDDKGRTVGFGARALPESRGKGPKYVNTPETAVFHKGRLIYGYDLALATLRKEKRLVLVEGYTDVMGAHQAGFRSVCAVLGTATTDEHAALVRRSGVRRVTLVFDGDDAGARATRKALVGLLPLGVEIDVAAPPDGADPCDLCIADGGKPFAELLDAPMPWVDFLVGRITAAEGLDERSLSTEVDELLEVVRVVRAPLHRAALLKSIAAGLGFDVADVRAQFEDLEKRRPVRTTPAVGRGAPTRGPDGPARGRGEPGGGGSRPTGAGSVGASDAWFPGSDVPPPDLVEGGEHDPNLPIYAPGEIPYSVPPPAASNRDRLRERRERQELKAFRDLTGALLADNGLIPRYLDPGGDDFFVNCPDPHVKVVVHEMRVLYYEGPEDVDVDAGNVAAALPEGIDKSLPARLEELARHGDAGILASDSLTFILRQDHRRAVDLARRELAEATTDEEHELRLGALADAMRKLQSDTT
ncbi:MAG: DNA primase [Planctomycetota bacterium]|nr:DNA primase [Planctomycetota bacterium]